MPTVFQKALQLLVGNEADTELWRVPSNRPLKAFTERDLIKLESEIGSRLFGPVPSGHRREFFCLDDRTWIWHEEWHDEKRKLQISTVRYEINEHGVLKVQEGARYSYLEGEELQNFALSVRLYYEQVARQIYKRDPVTGQKLV